MHNMKWSDLEYVLAVAASGSVSAAARQLDVNHSTVLRRVQTFEERSGIKIFNRLRTGYRVTAEGEIFLDAASSIEEIVQDMNRKIVGIDTGMSGEVSITTTDSLYPLLIEPIAALRARFPEVTYQIQVSNVRLNLDRRDADIAIRASVNPPSHLVGRKISNMEFGIYATREVQEAQGALPLAQRTWLGLDAPLMQSEPAKWMDAHVPESSRSIRIGSFVALAAAAENGAGFALLPKYIGDSSKKLVRTDADTKMPAAELWILTHRDVLAAPKIKMVSEKLYRHFRNQRALFEGR